MPTHHHHHNRHYHLNSDFERYGNHNIPDIDICKIKSMNDMITAPDGSPIDLPDTSRVAWHVSAGMDFRSLVFFTKGYLSSHPNTQGINLPSVHIFTCLSAHEKQLLTILESDNKELFRDKKTRICIKKYQLLRLHDAIQSLLTDPYPYSDSGIDGVFTELNAHGFLAEVEIQCLQSDYRETVKLIYLFTENIKTLTSFVCMELVNVQNIIALNEGLAFGGCKKSIITHIFEPPYYDLLRSHGFSPEIFVIKSEGQANGSFKKAIENGYIQSQIHPVSYLYFRYYATVHKVQFPKKHL